MIQITCKEALYTYDVYHIVKAFLPAAEIRQEINQKQESLIEIEMPGDSCFFAIQEEELSAFKLPERKQEVSRRIYRCLAEKTGRVLPWGILTGIRPTKLIARLLRNNMSQKEIIKLLREQYFISDCKAQLGLEIARRECSLLSRLDEQKGYSLYIGIPFCPTTCSYCSFTSYPVAAYAQQTELYLSALCREIAGVAEYLQEHPLNTIYIGGGTPTTLTAAELDRLLGFLKQTFSSQDVIEFTVEAGRPDSITRDKLQVLQNHGISRISINPQTMQQKTLDRIGRNHTVEQVVEAYQLARRLGFDNINMDLIAGLPGEGELEMKDTLRQIRTLSPDSLTVHALAIKRAARMGQEKQQHTLEGEELSAIIDMAAGSAGEMGMVPYYLYRQKNIAGSFENVGYAKVDKAGIYNILIMEEVQSIIALGAGATTKIVLPEPMARNRKVTNIVRIENVKDVTEYISRIDEMIARKEKELWYLQESR